MIQRLQAALWVAGWPVRQLVVLPIRAYRLTLGFVIGGGCRFHPTCSAYAVQAIEQAGVVRGLALSLWRVARCSPLSTGGVDHPPVGRSWRAVHSASARSSATGDDPADGGARSSDLVAAA
jgi:uncharacterized protein